MKKETPTEKALRFGVDFAGMNRDKTVLVRVRRQGHAKSFALNYAEVEARVAAFDETYVKPEIQRQLEQGVRFCECGRERKAYQPLCDDCQETKGKKK